MVRLPVSNIKDKGYYVLLGLLIFLYKDHSKS